MCFPWCGKPAWKPDLQWAMRLLNPFLFRRSQQYTVGHATVAKSATRLALTAAASSAGDSWIQYDTDRWAWHWLMSWQWCKYGAYTLRMRSSQVLSVLFSFLHYLRLYSWTVTSSVLLLVVTADFFLIATHCHLRLIVQKPTWSNHLSDAQMNLVSFLNFYYAIW